MLQMLNQKSDTYLGNINVKRDGVQHEFTKKEVNEYVKCVNDPVYFCTKYLKVISLDDGLVPFKLYPYQEDMFKHFDKNKNVSSTESAMFFISPLIQFLSQRQRFSQLSI